MTRLEEVLTCRSVAPLATASRRVGPMRSICFIDSKKVWKIPAKTCVLRIRPCPPILKLYRYHPKSPQVGAKLRRLRAKLGRSWSQLVQVGPKLRPCWPKLTPSRANVAAMSIRNGAFGRFWADLQTAQTTAVSCTFWHPALSNMFFSAEVAPVNRGLFESIGSARLGALCAGGFLFSTDDGPH